jgi:hypothetical protein
VKPNLQSIKSFIAASRVTAGMKADMENCLVCIETYMDSPVALLRRAVMIRSLLGFWKSHCKSKEGVFEEAMQRRRAELMRGEEFFKQTAKGKLTKEDIHSFCTTDEKWAEHSERLRFYERMSAILSSLLDAMSDDLLVQISVNERKDNES